MLILLWAGVPLKGIYCHCLYEQLSTTCSLADDVSQWETPWTTGQPATDNGVRDGRWNSLAITSTFYKAPIPDRYLHIANRFCLCWESYPQASAHEATNHLAYAVTQGYIIIIVLCAWTQTFIFYILKLQRQQSVHLTELINSHCMNKCYWNFTNSLLTP